MCRPRQARRSALAAAERPAAARATTAASFRLPADRAPSPYAFPRVRAGSARARPAPIRARRRRPARAWGRLSIFDRRSRVCTISATSAASVSSSVLRRPASLQLRSSSCSSIWSAGQRRQLRGRDARAPRLACAVSRELPTRADRRRAAATRARPQPPAAPPTSACIASRSRWIASHRGATSLSARRAASRRAAVVLARVTLSDRRAVASVNAT